MPAKTYLVGGAVRDMLLGVVPKDRDYVVVGSTREEMLNNGFTLIGADFGVFLHPSTGEEYALARTERKSGVGYNGFEVDASPEVTIELDLSRRDCTMNSMAMDLETNEIIDPFNGKRDLEQHIIRHTSEAFAEDPLRVLRVARFAARYGYTIASETVNLMRSLVDSGELAHLTAERVWVETYKALTEDRAWIYFQALALCKADKVLFPEINTRNLKALVCACTHDHSVVIRYGTLFCNVPNGKEISTRLKAPNDFNVIAHHVSSNLTAYVNFYRLSAKEVLKLLSSMDYMRKPDQVYNFLTVCESAGYNPAIAHSIRELLGLLNNVTVSTINVYGLTGKQIGNALEAAKVIVISKHLASHPLT